MKLTFIAFSFLKELKWINIIFFQTLPGDILVEDFSRSTDPFMQQAWKERLEPNMKVYEDMKVGYGNDFWFAVKLFTVSIYHFLFIDHEDAVVPARVPLVFPRTALYYFDNTGFASPMNYRISF